MHSAALVYNVLLAKARRWTDKQVEHEAALETWLAEIEMTEVRDWSLSRLWNLTGGQGHTITSATRRYSSEPPLDLTQGELI